MTNENVKLTKQDLFNNAWQAFVVEKSGPSLHPNGNTGCLYLSPSGCRCAIGVSFSVDVLKQLVDSNCNNLAIGRLIEEHSPVSNLLDPEEISFMCDLQACHDRPALSKQAEKGIDFHENVEGELRELAKNYFLQIPQ
jgi:hypothetical protein